MMTDGMKIDSIKISTPTFDNSTVPASGMHPLVHQKSAMRWSTRMVGKATTKAAKNHQIRMKRGAFFTLPVFYSSDLVHGSWW